MAWLFFLTSWPCLYLMAAWPTLAACIIAVSWLPLLKAGYSGVLPSLLGEQFPVATRAIGVSLSFSTAVTIFGGFAPFIATLADRPDRGTAVAKLLSDRYRRDERLGADWHTAAFGTRGAAEAGNIFGVSPARARARPVLPAADRGCRRQRGPRGANRPLPPAPNAGAEPAPAATAAGMPGSRSASARNR